LNILVIGKNGQLAWELEQTCPESVNLTCLSREQLDVTSQADVHKVITELQPNLVINAVAYTAVDKAETDRETAFAVNDLGCEYIAIACKANHAKLIHISTDFIFDGCYNKPYQVDHQPNPLGIYGESKLAGENKIKSILAGDASIIRTAWVYSTQGNNFVKSMLRLMQDKEQLGIVYDQVGTPTWAKGLAQAIWQLVPLKLTSQNIEASSHVYHWTDAGIASWYDFAITIQELAIEKGMLNKAIPVLPIPASAYPTPAKRPSFSVIDKKAIELKLNINTIHWRKQLSLMLDELKIKTN